MSSRSIGLRILVGLALFAFFNGEKTFSQNRVLELDDPLAGKTIGAMSGGSITPAGWLTKTVFDYIEYKIPTCSSGEVEYDVTGIYASNQVFPNIGYDKYGKVIPDKRDVHYTLFLMYDRDDDQSWYGMTQWHNPYKCIMHLYGYTEGDPYKWKRMKLRLNVAAFSGGYQDDPHAFEDPPCGPFEWEKEHVYHMRLVWGDGFFRWYMDGALIKEWDYSSFGVDYAPPDHCLRLGSGMMSRSGGYMAPVNVLYSNFKVYRHLDQTAPQVTGIEPKAGSTSVPQDADIIVNFSEPMDAASAEAAFSITPAVTGSFQWIGTGLAWKHAQLLQANTTYTVAVKTTAKDKAGVNLEKAFSATFTTRGAQVAAVGKYETYEVVLSAPGAGGRYPYRDVALKGVFRGPTRTIEIEGFYDGNDVWKVRMAPTEAGTWSYTITSTVAALNSTGSFTCSESGLPGFVRPNPVRPHTFAYDNGTPWLWKGDTAWRGYTSLIPYEGRWKSLVDLRVKQGHTVIQSIVNSYINGLDFWKNEGGTCFEEGTGAKDYDQLNPGYFRWVDKRIDYALDKGLVPVMLFSWSQEYVNFKSTQWEKFIRYLVARYAAKNVIWVLCGEYNEMAMDYNRPTSEFIKWGEMVRRYDPYDHPLTLHPTGRSTSAEFAHTAWMDVVMQQSPYSARDILRDRAYNKPVVNAEPRYMYTDTENSESRFALWEIVASGGYYTNGFITTYAPDKGGYDTEALPEEQRWVEFLNKLMDRLPLTEMEPKNNLISAGQLLAKPGSEYLAYNRNGGAVTIDLTDVAGTLPLEWLDPRAGVVHAAGTVAGGQKQTLTPPFSGDWGLHIGAGIRADAVPPNAPQALTSPSQTMHSIVLTWQAPAAAADGDRASSYLLKRDGTTLTSVAATTYTDQGLEELSSHRYEVYSLDDAGNHSATAASVTVTTNGDTQAPKAVEVKPISAQELQVVFDEKVESASAQNPANYQIAPAIGIVSITLAADGLSTTLKTNAHAAGQSYTLTIRNIKDRARIANTLASQNLTYRFETNLQISNLSPATYSIAQLAVNDAYYVDRTFRLLTIPAICQGFTWIKTENDDKERSDAHWLSFKTNMTATVMVAYDRGVSTMPAWLESWQDTGESLTTTDDTTLRLYRKVFPAGEIVLGGNEGTSKSSMYLVLVKKSDETVADSTPPGVPQGFGFAL